MAADISGMGTQSNPDARLLATCLGISRWLEDTTDVRPGAETRLRCQIDGGLANALLGLVRRGWPLGSRAQNSVSSASSSATRRGTSSTTISTPLAPARTRACGAKSGATTSARTSPTEGSRSACSR